MMLSSFQAERPWEILTLVPQVLRRNGIEIHFSGINVKPGRPMTFGTSPDGAVFGFPGNPVSTFVLFEVLAKPFLYRMMGYDFREMFFRLPIGEKLTRTRAERADFIPVRIDRSSTVIPMEYNGSANISSFREADGLISFPVGIAEIAEGSMVEVRPI